MFDISVILCAHNPRPEYLRRTLESLRRQSFPKDRWQLLLVDNASKAPLESAWDISWHPNARHVFESELGLSSARRRGMLESSADVLIFVDDDNVLEQNYLEQSDETNRGWPMLGVWGAGAIVPEFEVQPPEDVKPLVPYLALREIKVPQWSNVFPCVEATPWGAGLCVRSNVAKAYRRHYDQSRIQISDRKGKALLSGGDVEISFVACDLGFGMATFPKLRLTHLIPKERVSREYLLKIFEGTGTSNELLAYKWKGRFPVSPFRPWGMLSILKNVLIRRGLDRRMYLANLRAGITARRIIAGAQSCENDRELTADARRPRQ